MSDLLQTQHAILTALRKRNAQHAWRLHEFDCLPSSNQYLLEQAQQENIHAHICWVHNQTQGRGRHGRQWHSADSTNLTFSIGWQHTTLPLSIIAGYALLQALHHLQIDDLALKWPNDVLRKGAKLAGILVETRGAQQIVGFGVNMSGAANLQQLLKRDIADLSDSAITMEALIVEICSQLANVIQQVEIHGMARFVAAWDAWHALQGANVVVSMPALQMQATVLGLEQNGDLRVQSEQQIMTIRAAEVTLTQ